MFVKRSKAVLLFSLQPKAKQKPKDNLRNQARFYRSPAILLPQPVEAWGVAVGVATAQVVSRGSHDGNRKASDVQIAAAQRSETSPHRRRCTELPDFPPPPNIVSALGPATSSKIKKDPATGLSARGIRGGKAGYLAHTATLLLIFLGGRSQFYSRPTRTARGEEVHCALCLCSGWCACSCAILVIETKRSPIVPLKRKINTAAALVSARS